MSHCGKKNVSSVNSLQKYTNHKQINLTFVSELKGTCNIRHSKQSIAELHKMNKLTLNKHEFKETYHIYSQPDIWHSKLRIYLAFNR